jgi:glycosyltransferase involved in cell wall biosynthesis
VTTRLVPEAGGATSSITGFARALLDQKIAGEMVTTIPLGRIEGEAEVPLPMRSFREARLSAIWPGYAPGMARHLEAAVSDYDLIHVHELWHFPQFAAARAARKSAKPYVVTPHGELSSWAMGHKRWKKRLYWQAIQRGILRDATLIHTLSDAETGDVRRLGLDTPVGLVANGFDPAQYADLPPAEVFLRSHPELSGKQIILFLGRLHPIKGLDLLVRAFGTVAEKHRDAWLVIAGPDSNGYRGTLEAWLTAENVLSRTTLTGFITGQEKLSALAGSSIFVLPSYSEAQSVAVLEGMASGLPVIATKTCGVPELAEAGGGFLTNADAGELATALDRMLSDETLRERMGREAKKLAFASYTWPQAAVRMADLYRRAIDTHGGGRSTVD